MHSPTSAEVSANLADFALKASTQTVDPFARQVIERDQATHVAYLAALAGKIITAVDTAVEREVALAASGAPDALERADLRNAQVSILALSQELFHVTTHAACAAAARAEADPDSAHATAVNAGQRIADEATAAGRTARAVGQEFLTSDVWRGLRDALGAATPALDAYRDHTQTRHGGDYPVPDAALLEILADLRQRSSLAACTLAAGLERGRYITFGRSVGERAQNKEMSKGRGIVHTPGTP